MSNTIIELRHSYVTGNVPSSLANGEIAINTYDGKLFYRGGPSNTIQTIERYSGPAGLDTEIQFNDSGVLGSSANLTFNKLTGLFRTGNVTANTVTTRDYVQFGDGTRQYTANAGSGGGTTDQYARNTANAAFETANNAASVNTTQNNSITAAFTTANSAGVYANGAFTRANNSLDANNGGTVTGTITATSFITTGSYGNIQGANIIYANTFVANTGGYVQFGDGTKQYTANAGSGGGNTIPITISTFNTTANGTTSTYDLGFNPVSANAIFVTIDGVVQPESTYTVNTLANTITFTTSPANTENVRVVAFAQTNPYVISTGSIGTAELAAGSVTPDKLSTSTNTYIQTLVDAGQGTALAFAIALG